MTQLITIVLTSLAVTGTYFTIKEFLWTFNDSCKFNEFYSDGMGWYYKPLFTCVTCMSSVWGTIYYWSISLGLYLMSSNGLFIDDGTLLSMIIFWPITCVSCAFINTFFYKLIEG